MFNAKEEVTRVVLKKLFTQQHFSICVLDEMAKLHNLLIPTETYNLLRPLHCIQYSDMSKELRGWVFESMLDIFEYKGFELSKIDHKQLNSLMAEFVDVEKTGLRKMISKAGIN